MTSQIEEQTTGSSKDSALLVLSVLMVGGALTAFYYFAEWATVLRILVLLGGIGAAAALAYQTAFGSTAWSFIRDCYRIELRKTTWPTRAESVQTTLMIAVVVLISALLLWGLDSSLLWGVKTLTGRG